MPLFFADSHEELLRLNNFDYDDNAGGHVCFAGTVRRRNHGQDVAFLDYESHTSLAQSMFCDLEASAKTRFGLIKSHACHRLGRVHVGHMAVVIHALAAHRNEAFFAARYLIDELKQTLPIWRKEVYYDETFTFESTSCHLDHAVKTIFSPPKRALMAMGLDHAELTHKHVLLIGAGGLGCPIALNLAALKVKLTIVDGDDVSLSNLARQYAYRLGDEGLNKATLLSRFIAERFGLDASIGVAQFVDETRVIQLVEYADLVIDATDDPATKLLLKRLAYKRGFSLISASVHQQDGEVQVYSPSSVSCLLCFDRERAVVQESCSLLGVLTHVCQMIAAVVVDRALMLLNGRYEQESTITIVDPGQGLFILRIARDPWCKNCGDGSLRQKPLMHIMRQST